jgi:hypothetical protein
MQNTLNYNQIRNNKHKYLSEHLNECEYQVNDKVEFLNKKGIWVSGVVVGYNIKSNRFQVIIKCNNKKCKLHKVCIHSLYLRKRE